LEKIGKELEIWRLGRAKGKEILEMIQEKDGEEKEENKQEFERDKIEEWDEENEMGNLQDPYNKL